MVGSASDFPPCRCAGGQGAELGARSESVGSWGRMGGASAMGAKCTIAWGFPLVHSSAPTLTFMEPLQRGLALRGSQGAAPRWCPGRCRAGRVGGFCSHGMCLSSRALSPGGVSYGGEEVGSCRGGSDGDGWAPRWFY